MRKGEFSPPGNLGGLAVVEQEEPRARLGALRERRAQRLLRLELAVVRLGEGPEVDRERGGGAELAVSADGLLRGRCAPAT
jgi:hypothetical protein